MATNDLKQVHGLNYQPSWGRIGITVWNCFDAERYRRGIDLSWKKHWKHTFSRLYTLIRGVLLNFFDLSSMIQYCDTMGRRGARRLRGAPERAYQMFFDFA